MKPTLRKAIPGVENSFVVRRDKKEMMKNCWHYHAEYELLYLKKSAGIWLVGDFAGNFECGDVVLLGPHLPHSFRHEDKYVSEDGEALVALFLAEILGDVFLNLPESRDIGEMLKLCKRGLKITGNTRIEIGRIMEETQNAASGRKLINLLHILQLITESKEFETLASNGYVYPTDKNDSDRLNSVIRYTNYNYQRQISIDEVAAIANMGPQSFCRYFKDKTKKTYIQYLMEVRIGQACRLLIENDINVAEAGYLCGYNSISHFNYQFKLIKEKSPLEFKRSHLKHLQYNGEERIAF